MAAPPTQGLSSTASPVKPPAAAASTSAKKDGDVKIGDVKIANLSATQNLSPSKQMSMNAQNLSATMGPLTLQKADSEIFDNDNATKENEEVQMDGDVVNITIS